MTTKLSKKINNEKKLNETNMNEQKLKDIETKFSNVMIKMYNFIPKDAYENSFLKPILSSEKAITDMIVAKINPLIYLFYKSILPLEDKIKNKNEDFFLNKDYSTECKNNNQLLAVISYIKEYSIKCDKETKIKIFSCLEILCIFTREYILISNEIKQLKK